MSGHFDDKAAFLAALPAGDTERQVAFEHAQSCPRCARALTEGMRIIELLDAALELPEAALDAERLEQMMQRADKEILADERRPPPVPILAVIAAWVLEVAIAKNLTTDRESVLWSLSVLGAAIIAAAFCRAGLRTFMGAIVISGLFALTKGSGGSLHAAIGIKCALLEIVAASLPWAALWWASRGNILRSQGAAVAAAGALAGHAALHLSCPVPHAEPHLLAFHLGGVVLAALLGAFATSVGRRMTERH